MTVSRADVTISSATTGPVSGDGGAFTVTGAGEITGSGNGIEAGTGGTAITTLDVQGGVNVSGYALNVADGASLATTVNSGVMAGDRVIQTYGGTSIGTITNSGTMSATGYGVLLYGTSGTFSNLAGGLVQATGSDAIYLIGPTGAVSNAGTIVAGGNGLFAYDLLTTATNSGSMQGGTYGVYVVSSGSTGLLANSGSIIGGVHGVQNSGRIGTATNSGSMSGVRGLQSDPGSTFGTLTNSGTVQGSDYGMVMYATTDTLHNVAGGLIEATTSTDGVYHEGTTTTFTNDGRIAGVRHGVSNNGSGTLSAIANTGTLTGGSGGAGLRLNATTTTGTLSNSGLIDGDWGVYQDSGTITTLTNSGTLSGVGNQGDGIYVNAGTITTLVNQTGGRIAGNNMAIQTEAAGSIGSIDNAGTISGWWGLYSAGGLGTFVNRSTGVVQSNGYEAFASGSLTSFTNEVGGLIAASNYTGVVFGGNVTTVDNAGTISGHSSYAGMQVYRGTAATLTNTGTITGGTGILNDSVILTLTNSGTVQGTTRGMTLSGSTGMLTNAGGGRISATNDDGVYVLGTVTNFSNAGTIAGGTGSDDSGVELRTAASIGTLSNTGIIGGLYGISTNNTSTIGSIVNSGTIAGVANGIYNNGNLIASLINHAGGLITGTNNAGISGGGFGTIDNAGTIEGSYGVNHYSTPALGSFINRSTGVVRGLDSGYGFYSSRAVNSFTNEAGGLIESVNYEGVYLSGDGVGTFDNAGTIRSLDAANYAGLYVGDSVTTLTNSGTISGYYGIYKDDAIDTLTNTATGLLRGTDSGLYVSDSADMTVVNHGRIEGGGKGVYAYYDFGPFTNKSGGVVSGTNTAGILIEDDARLGVTTITNEAGGLIESTNGAGVLVNASGYDRGTLVNDGTITGPTGGVRIDGGGLLSITNSGTITGIVNAGTIGDGTGLAISSTGAGASIGTLTNSGTINGGVTVANQDLVVHGGTTARGVFMGSDITVLGGSMTLASGNTLLESDVVVSSAGGVAGQGTLTNLASLALGGLVNLDGAYAQSGAASFISILRGLSTYGNLAATGAASFDGVLGLEQDGFSLAPGQNFLLFSFASATGAFDGLLIDGVATRSVGSGQWRSGRLLLSEQWTGTTMSLSVQEVPEIDPAGMGSVLALLTAAAGLLERRRRVA